MDESVSRSGLQEATVRLTDGTVPLRDFTLLAEPGELLAILGSSGSGKSTVLRAIAGLDEVIEGRVLIGGEPADEPGRRDVAMVFQDNHLIPFLDAARNMGFPLDLAKVPRDEARSRVQREASRFGLQRVLGRKPGALSPGEGARVSLGRVTARLPRVFLLDEPFAHLEAATRVRLRQELRQLVRQSGVTTFFVTHDQSDALSMGDRLAVIDDGRLLQLGTGRELYERPASTAVIDLVTPGRIALLPACLVIADGQAGFRVGERILPTWAPPGDASWRHDQPVVIGIRQEDVHESPSASDGTLTGVVRTVEPTGPHTTVGIDTTVGELFARFASRSTPRRGERITVGIDAARASVFDPDTGLSLADEPGAVVS